MRVLPQEGQHMAEVHDPDAERDNEPTADPAAVAAAVRAAATNVMTQASGPIAQFVGDNIRSISADALQNFPGAGVADAIGVSSAIQDSLRHLHPIDGGLTSSGRTAMEAISRGAVASIKSPLSGLSPEIIGGHRSITDLITATAPDRTPLDHLHQRQVDLGVGRSLQATIDRLTSIQSVVGDRLQQYDYGVKHLPGMQSAIDALTRHESTFAKAMQQRNAAIGQLHGERSTMLDALARHEPAFTKALQQYDYGIGQLRGVQSAAAALITRTSALDTVMQHYDRQVGQLTGAAAAIKALSADWQTGGPGRFALDYLGSGRGAFTDLLGMQTYGASMAALMRESQHSVQEFMRQRALMPDPAAWMRDLHSPVEAIAEMLRSWWPAADRGFHAARVALRAAMRVVRLLTTNDPGAREAVQQFLIDWLGFRHRSHDLVTSATLVLLNVSSWRPTGAVPLDFDPRPKLRALTLAEHRAVTRLSTDPKLRFQKQPLLSLEQPVKVTDNDTTPTSLRELLPDRAAPDPSAVAEPEFSDPRIVRVWWRLNAREQEILRVKGQPGVTWAAAAVECGGTPNEGDRLRRKVNRLARKDSDPQPPIAEAG